MTQTRRCCEFATPIDLVDLSVDIAGAWLWLYCSHYAWRLLLLLLTLSSLASSVPFFCRRDRIPRNQVPQPTWPRVCSAHWHFCAHPPCLRERMGLQRDEDVRVRCATVLFRLHRSHGFVLTWDTLKFVCTDTVSTRISLPTSPRVLFADRLAATGTSVRKSLTGVERPGDQ